MNPEAMEIHSVIWVSFAFVFAYFFCFVAILEGIRKDKRYWIVTGVVGVSILAYVSFVL